MIIPFKTNLGNIKYIKKLLLILLPVLFLLFPKIAFSESSHYVIKNLIKNSTRDFNPAIIYWINNYDLETAIAIAKTLSKRHDYFIGDIISDLVFNRTNKNRSTKEYILRILLDNFFNSGEKFSRIKENSSYLVIIMNHLQNFKDPFVKAELLQLLPLLKYKREKSILMLESCYIIKRLKNSSVSPELNLEIKVFLNTVNILPDISFLEPIIMISSLTEDKEITNISRKVLRHLSGLN